MTTPRIVLVPAGILAGASPLVGNGLYAGPGDDGAEILAEARDGLSGIAYVAYAIDLLGFVALAVLLAGLVVLLSRPAPVAAASTGILGAAMLAVKVGSVVPSMALRTEHQGVDPDTAELVASFNDQAFVVAGFFLCLSLASAGVGLLRTDEPRWLAWWAATCGILGAAAGVTGILRPDQYVPIPFLLLLLWMIALGVSTALTGNRETGVAPGVGVPQ